MDGQEGECEDRWSQLAETELTALHPTSSAAANDGREGGGLEWGVAGRALPRQPHAVSAHDDGPAHGNGNGHAAHGNGNAANGYGNGHAANGNAAANDDAATTPLYGELMLWVHAACLHSTLEQLLVSSVLWCASIGVLANAAWAAR